MNTVIIKIVKNQLAKKKKDKEKITLETIYPDWLAYKSLHTEKTSSIKRYSTEWKRYYMSDPIIKKPLDELSVLMLDEWAHRMIKHHKMNKKQYYTMSIILRQSLQYAKNRGDISENPFEAVKIESKMFRKTKKKADGTQVYLVEEQELIIQEAWKDYNSSNAKETTPLAVILAFYLDCRPGETVAIREEDIRGQYIHIQRMETQLEEALKFNNEKSNIITFVNPCNMDQVTIGNQNQI